MKKPFIMLVDDEVPFVETMVKRLTKRELVVLTAYDGQEALDKLKTNQDVDVVRLDVKMPGMDGIQVLKKIKELYPLIEVIMLTGHATVETAIEGMRLGAFDYLKKPTELEDLLAKAEEALKKKEEHLRKIRDAAVREAITTHGV